MSIALPLPRSLALSTGRHSRSSTLAEVKIDDLGHLSNSPPNLHRAQTATLALMHLRERGFRAGRVRYGSTADPSSVAEASHSLLLWRIPRPTATRGLFGERRPARHATCECNSPRFGGGEIRPVTFPCQPSWRAYDAWNSNALRASFDPLSRFSVEARDRAICTLL